MRERERERERNTPTERSVLILARKLRKTKEACRNSVSLDKSANRSSPGESSWPGESSAASESIDSVHVTFQSCIFSVAPFQTLQRVWKGFNNWFLYLIVLLNALYAPQNWNIRNIGTSKPTNLLIFFSLPLILPANYRLYTFVDCSNSTRLWPSVVPVDDGLITWTHYSLKYTKPISAIEILEKPATQTRHTK